MGTIEYSCKKKPLVNEYACGDYYFVKEYDESVCIILIDVLGHGKEAYELTQICEEFLQKHYKTNPFDLIQQLNNHIKGSRGAVAAIGQLDTRTGLFTYVLIGDITIRRFALKPQTAVCRPGIVGYMMPTPRVEQMNVHPGDVLLLHTDGVSNHFKLSDYPGILNDSIDQVSKTIIERFAKKHDDSACIALRYKP